MTTSLYIGIDGGGTRTTLGLGNAAGEELARRSGGAGIVDPRRPLAAAEALLAMVDDLLSEAGIRGPVEALCAGLAGTGNATEREAVQGALLEAGVSHRVMVCSDGEIALEGALMGRAGVLRVGSRGGWPHCPLRRVGDERRR